MTEAEELRLNFDIQAVINYFGRSICGEDDIQIYEYILAYDELRRLFGELGILFKFVDSDVSEKCGILRQLNTENTVAYSTVKTMIDHENGKANVARGSRTLLRLHRALEFLAVFVEQVCKSEENASVAEILRTSYTTTLAKHHSWLVRKSIGLASSTVPGKSQLIQIIFNNAVDHDIDSTASEFLTVINNVFERTQIIYEKNDLLNLP